jgi:translation initiation factor IF-3
MQQYSHWKWWWWKWSYRIYKNEEIKAPKILLIDESGETIWTVSRFEAIKRSQELEMDLVQVSYDAATMISTCKIIDFGKFQYEKKKLENEKKKATKIKWQKEIKFWYNIGDNDLQFKLDQAVKFLDDWYTVKLIARLKWRENSYKEILRVKFDFIHDHLWKIWRSQWVKSEANGYSIAIMPIFKK